MYYRREHERLMAEHQQAVEQLAEKETEVYQTHEANLASIEIQRRELDELRAKHQQEQLTAWQQMEQEKLALDRLKPQGLFLFDVRVFVRMSRCYIATYKQNVLTYGLVEI